MTILKSGYNICLYDNGEFVLNDGAKIFYIVRISPLNSF